MKTFKQFISEQKEKDWKDSPIEWDSSFAEQRKKQDWKDSPIEWDSSFAGQRDKPEQVQEDEHKSRFGPWVDADPTKENRMATGKKGGRFDVESHNPAHIQPRNLQKHHHDAMHHYTMTGSDEPNGYASSGNMNAYLRNRSGNKTQSIRHDHKENMVKDAVSKLSSTFTEQNTNRKPITTYAGVPAHVGEMLQKSGKDSHHHFPGFTSTSTNRETAANFAHGYDRRGKDRHVVQFHVGEGAGLSMVHHSEFPEDEILLHHGAHVQYHKTETHDGGVNLNNEPVKLHVHHVTVHPDHKPLDEYGEYHHKETED